jgi:hypothetical protein
MNIDFARFLSASPWHHFVLTLALRYPGCRSRLFSYWPTKARSPIIKCMVAQTGFCLGKSKQKALAGLRLRWTDATEEQWRREFRLRPAILVNHLREVSQEHRPQKEMSYDCVF